MKKDFKFHLYGQTLVEFALILPVFVFLLVVIFDLGRAVYYYNAIHNAAREGVRYGAVNSIKPSPTIEYADDAGMRKAVKDFAVGLGLTDENIVFADIDPDYYETVGGELNPTVRVEVKYDFYPVTPFIDFFLSCDCSYITLTSDAVMRTEWMPKPLPTQ